MPWFFGVLVTCLIDRIRCVISMVEIDIAVVTCRVSLLSSKMLGTPCGELRP